MKIIGGIWCVQEFLVSVYEIKLNIVCGIPAAIGQLSKNILDGVSKKNLVCQKRIIWKYRIFIMSSKRSTNYQLFIKKVYLHNGCWWSTFFNIFEEKISFFFKMPTEESHFFKILFFYQNEQWKLFFKTFSSFFKNDHYLSSLFFLLKMTVQELTLFITFYQNYHR